MSPSSGKQTCILTPTGVCARSGILPQAQLPRGTGPTLLSTSLVFLSLYSQHSSLLRAGTEVALHLSLVHPIQGQHHEDTPKSQCPESVPYKRIWIQPTTDANWSLWHSPRQTQPSSHSYNGGRAATG